MALMQLCHPPCHPHPPPQGSRAQTGFGLLECLAAVVILGSAVVAGLSLFEVQDRLTGTNVGVRKGLTYLDREAERIRATSFESLSTTSFSSLAEDSTYETRWIVTGVDGVTKQVVAEIRWTTFGGATRIDSVATVRCKGVR